MDFGSIEELYKTDKELVEKGAPVTIGMNVKDKPIIMYVAEAGNSKHKKIKENTIASLKLHEIIMNEDSF